MSRDINSLQSKLNTYQSFSKEGRLYRMIDDFESYYQKLQNKVRPKTWYTDMSHRGVSEGFLNVLLDWNEAKKKGELNAEQVKGFEDVLNSLQKEEKSALKKLMRTEMMDLCDTMAGDLESKNGKEKHLDQFIALAELYDRVLNEQDKKDMYAAFNHGEAKEFLTKTDHRMEGNFSKTLRAFYNRYREANQTEAEKAKWQKLCYSYAVRPYMKVISVRVKQEEKQRAEEEAFNALPKEEQEKRLEAKALKQDPDQFMNMSPMERNEIRRTAAANKLEEKRQQEIAALKKDLKKTEDHATWTHRFFVEKPERLARKSADLNQLSTKDSDAFRKMHDSLTKLRNTDGYRQMDQLLAEGKGQQLIENLNQAIDLTKKYITHAEQKTFLQKGILGSKRLSAAKDTLAELTNLSQAIREEMAALQDRRNKKEKLELLEGEKAPEFRQLPENGWKKAETDTNQSEKKVGLKLNVNELTVKFDGKKSKWVDVDVLERPNTNTFSDWEIVEKPKTTNKGMNK